MPPILKTKVVFLESIFIPLICIFQKVTEPLYELNMDENGDLYLDVAEAYMENGYYKQAETILGKLVKSKNYDLVRLL